MTKPDKNFFKFLSKIIKKKDTDSDKIDFTAYDSIKCFSEISSPMENQTQILIDLWYSTSFGEKDTFDVNNRRLDHYKNTTVTPKIKNDKIHEGKKF